MSALHKHYGFKKQDRYLKNGQSHIKPKSEEICKQHVELS